jgi:RimJ/RimL family protein N-acetyltransferase
VLTIRKAQMEDCKEVWQWWNDPVTRKMMKKNDFVPWEIHLKWFRIVISPTTDKFLHLCLMDNKKIGVVRFDDKGNSTFEVSINMNPHFRGKGFGKKMLEQAIKYFTRENSVKKLFAVFKKINIPSKKTFLYNKFVIKREGIDYSILNNFDIDKEYYSERLFEL